MIVWIALASLLALLSPVPADAATTLRDDPGGFDGMKWLVAPSDVSGLHLLYDERDFTTYLKTGSSHDFVGAALESVRYQFYKGRLANVQIRFTGHEGFERLKTWLSDLALPPGLRTRSAFRLRLTGPETIISLEYDRTEGRGILSFASRAIETELVSNGLNEG